MRWIEEITFAGCNRPNAVTVCQVPLSAGKVQSGCSVLFHMIEHPIKQNMPASEENRHGQKENYFSNRNLTFFGSLSLILSRFPGLQIDAFPFPSHTDRCTMDPKGTLPGYSDRIAQDLHLIPFSRLAPAEFGTQAALNT